jgi:hypothetical protein
LEQAADPAEGNTGAYLPPCTYIVSVLGAVLRDMKLKIFWLLVAITLLSSDVRLKIVPRRK